MPMAAMHLTERHVKAAMPSQKDRLIFDETCPGFAVCVYASGRRAFVLTYRIAGRLRRFTIGGWPIWSVSAAREEAKALKRDIDRGIDPLRRRQDARDAPSIGDLIERYIAEHVPGLAKRNGDDHTSMLRKLVKPEWGARKAAEIEPADVERLLSKIAEGRARPKKAKPKNKRRRNLKPARPTPIRANRVGEVLRKMFNLAIAWKMRSDNPALGFRKRQETERERFLSMAEIGRLAEALGAAADQRAAGVIRLCLLTGARLGEVRQARFEEFDLERMIWIKQAAQTKQRRIHRVPISVEAAALVRHRRQIVGKSCAWLFPGDIEGQPVQEIRRFWRGMQRTAGLPDVRIHDLRHTFASLLVSGGASLEMIGKLLGHTQIRTTQRYAHLLDSPLRAGVNHVGNLLRPRLQIVHNRQADPQEGGKLG
tara:strand:+ start:649 stop:1923 length:1275 start_codon:yes stop_codon:yes gene_type:complete